MKGEELDKAMGTNQFECLKKAIAANVKIVIGTDFIGWEDLALNITEFTTLVKLGMKPMEVIKAGTRRAAECLMWESKVGSIKPSLFADIIAVKTDDLLADLSQLEKVEFVMKGGRTIKSQGKIQVPIL